MGFPRQVRRASLRDARRKIPLRFAADIRRLKAVVQDRNAPQKHVWRAGIVLLTADGVGTNEIMRRTAKSKTCVKERSWATAMDPGEEPGRLIPD